MTNLVEILKNAPKGLELYSPICGRCTLADIHKEYFRVHIRECDYLRFDEYGRIDVGGECCLFPSKECKLWTGWKFILFKPGHFITAAGFTFYIKSKLNCDFKAIGKDGAIGTLRSITPFRFASTEEIEHFYVELRKNGYTIKNGELKPAEKCEIRLEGYPTNISVFITEAIKKITLIDSKPFTIDDFKPFDKVLVRSIFGWKIEFFAIYHKGWDTPYECLGGSYDKCVPYNEETKCLLSTFIEYNGKYKTW